MALSAWAASVPTAFEQGLILLYGTKLILTHTMDT